MESMLVKHSLTVTMDRNPSIRRRVNDIEDVVRSRSESGYSQPQILPVPDELDPEIPRMIFSSRAGHSQILVSQLAITFNANYSADWAAEPDKCLNYLLSKIEMLFKIAHVGWEGSQPRFSGVVTTFQIGTNTASEAVGVIAPSFAESEKLIKEAGEVSYRWSLASDNRYYNNISVSTLVKLRGTIQGSVDSIPKFNEKTVAGYGVEVNGDFNDRLAYNMQDAYVSDETIARSLATTGFQKTCEVVASLLKGGGK